MKVFGVVGWKNAGKTTLVERLVTEIAGRGLTVSTIKRAHHRVDVDQEGTDSWRHRQAGAREVMLASSRRWALMHELREEAEPSLDMLLGQMSAVDLVIVEGFKRGGHAKVEIHRVASGGPLLAQQDETVRAVVTDAALTGLARPLLGLDDIAGIADFILADVGLARVEAAR
ncbi:molybdopterin-guanine dinucleotide biosynthesis protein B [Acuticoccus sp. I52.16.1]|uniref:molybdopterin-guanine dinucleotide biosynthesis protein B n=1 Tax=Acuticoccus sp. I52.16.1 TaxID=2928472 RepID=UPI001FCFAB04|nr:molybdopterin-guanine dinucleotide biosynthesis protein B [Acuticoccus sp. I52.16.1]UOM34419.1 molybdopterin-guanine dinucleotide biosynthesis protein B [Acuticoccus sp. I52.16.1]